MGDLAGQAVKLFNLCTSVKSVDKNIFNLNAGEPPALPGEGLPHGCISGKAG